MVANLVRQSPVEELVARLTSRKTISKEQVVRESTAMIISFLHAISD